MRVAHVNQDPGIGPGRKKGAAVHVRALRDAFAELGAEVLALDEREPERIEAELARGSAGAGLDLVYERYALGAYAAGEFARERGVCHVLEVNAPLEDEARRFRPDAPLPTDPDRERAMFENAAAVVAVSEPVARYAIDRGARAERVSVVANGVDPRRFHPGARDEALRASRVRVGSLVVGFHGRLRPWHNLDLLVRAVARLNGEGVPCHLWTIGEGPYEETVAGRLDGSSWCHDPWIPHERIAASVACFDVLGLCYEASADFYFSPLKLAEGMAAGAVPVVPDVGALPHEVEHGVSGLVFSAGSEDALCDALRRVASDADLRASLSAGALAAAQGRTWVGIARELLTSIGVA